MSHRRTRRVPSAPTGQPLGPDACVLPATAFLAGHVAQEKQGQPLASSVCPGELSGSPTQPWRGGLAPLGHSGLFAVPLTS